MNLKSISFKWEDRACNYCGKSFAALISMMQGKRHLSVDRLNLSKYCCSLKHEEKYERQQEKRREHINRKYVNFLIKADAVDKMIYISEEEITKNGYPDWNFPQFKAIRVYYGTTASWWIEKSGYYRVRRKTHNTSTGSMVTNYYSESCGGSLEGSRRYYNYNWEEFCRKYDAGRTTYLRQQEIIRAIIYRKEQRRIEAEIDKDITLKAATDKDSQAFWQTQQAVNLIRKAV